MQTIGRAVMYLFGAAIGAALGATVGFGVVLALFWVGNGGRMPVEMGGGFVLLYSGLAGIAAGLPGLAAGIRFTSRLIESGDGRPADRSGNPGPQRDVQ